MKKIIIKKDNEPIKLLNYQQQALNKFQLIRDLDGHKRFYFGFKMGLGKTYTALYFFKQNNINNFFIVTKKNLLNQWAQNYYDIFKNDNFEILDQTDSQQIPYDNNSKVYICSYERFKKILLLNNSKVITNNDIKKYKLDDINVILDESQILKSHKSQITKLFLKNNDNFNNLLLLSGSAISNNLDGLYAQYVLLRNSNIGYYNWARTYFNIGSSKFSQFVVYGIKKQNIDQFMNNFNQYAYFKNTEDVFNINDINYININCYEDKNDKEHMFKIDNKIIKNKMLLDNKNKFISLLDSPLLVSAKVRQLLSGFIYGQEIDDVMLNNLNNFDNNDDLVVKYNNQVDIKDNPNQESPFEKLNNKTLVYKNHPKFDMLVDLLKSNENYLCFYNFLAEKEIISQIAKQQGYNCYYIDGNSNDLNKILKDNKDNRTIIIAQCQASSQGIDGLQKNYHNIIYYSLPYSYELFSQGNARLHRIGQEQNVNVYYLNCHYLEQLLWQKLSLYKDYNDLIFYQDINNFFNLNDNKNSLMF